MRRTWLLVRLKHDTGTFWGIIILTRNCKMLPFEHDVVRRSKRWAKGQHRNCLRFWCGKYLCKVTWCMQFLRSCVRKATWSWASLKFQKGHTKVIIELFWYFDVKNTPIKWHHHTSNTCEVIAFAMQSSKKVTQRSTSNAKINLSKILMWRTHLSSYNLRQVIYQELSCSQGPSRYCPLESLKRSQKGQHQAWLKFWCGEHNSL